MLRAVNVSVGFDGATKIEMRVLTGKNRPRAQLWAQLQHQVKRHAVINKWVNLVKEGKKFNLTLEVPAATATKTSATLGQQFCRPKRANKKGHRLEKLPSTFESNPIGQYKKYESHQEARKLSTELFIKVLGLFKELPLNALLPLAKLLLIFSVSIKVLEEILEDDSTEDALRPEIMLFIMNLFIIVQHLEETNHLGSSVLRGSMQFANSNKQIFIPVLGSIGLMNLPGAHACHSTDLGIEHMSGKEAKEPKSYEALAWTLAALGIGGVAAWKVFKRPARDQAFAGVDEGLSNSPVPRKSNPVYTVLPAL